MIAHDGELITGQLIDLAPAWLHEERDDRGRWASGGTGMIERVTEPIRDEGARGNSRAVSEHEFQQLAAEGRDRLHAIQGAPWSTSGLDHGWEAIKARTYAEVQKSWGGATIDPRTGRDLPQGADKYAMSIKPTGLDTTSLPEHASLAEFSQAMDIAKSKYGRQLAKGGSYLGVFHDNDLNRIDIDPVTVLDSLREVETVGAWTHAIGGAYHFQSGDGFWPPHVASGAALSNPNPHWAGPGQWHSHAIAVQQPHDEPGLDLSVTITGQLIDLGWHDAWMHEMRGLHGEWISGGGTEASRLGRALAGTFVLPGQHAGPLRPDERPAEAAVKSEADKTARIVSGLIGGGAHENAWNGKVHVYPQASNPGILAELDWGGTLNVSDGVASWVRADGASKPGSTVQYPDAHEVILHEMIHGIVPAGQSRKADEKAYQDYAHAQIEEGFTELGAIHHAPDFFTQIGLADRPTTTEKSGFVEWGPDGKPVKSYYTVGEVAREIADPANIAEGNTWGHYKQQAKDAQDWVQQIAKEEGFSDLRPGTPGHTRVVQLTDAVNRQGTADKIETMAQQMAYATVKQPQLRDSQDFMLSLMDSVEKSIEQEWSKGAPDAGSQAFTVAKHSVQVRADQMMREIAAGGTIPPAPGPLAGALSGARRFLAESG